MSIDIVVTEDSELSEVAAAPQEGVRDLPAQRGPYLVEETDDKTWHGKHPRIIEFRTGFGQLCNTLVPDIHTW